MGGGIQPTGSAHSDECRAISQARLPIAAAFLVPIMIGLQGQRRTPCVSAHQMHSRMNCLRRRFIRSWPVLPGVRTIIAMPAKGEGHKSSLEYTLYGTHGSGRGRGTPTLLPRPPMVSSTSTVLSNPIAPICLFLDGEPRGR